jgi:hypothetical protein
VSVRWSRGVSVAALTGIAAMVGPAVAGAGPVRPAAASAPTASTVTGTIVAVNRGDFIVRTPGATRGRLDEMVSYANRLEAENLYYVFGGGHGTVGVPSGTHGRRGFDCSGVVAAVLAAGGLWPKGTAVPSDAGIIQQLHARKLIASGPGSGLYQVVLFDDPGKDIVMKIDGRFYGTGDGIHGGGGWYDEGPLGFPHVYREYHVLAGALGESRSDANDETFTFGPGAAQQAVAREVTVGAKVQVTYGEVADSTLRAESVTHLGGTAFNDTRRGTS